MKRLVILTVLCGTIFCACTADKNRAGNNLPTGSTIDSSTTGSIAAASGSMANVTEAAVKSNNSKKIQTDDIRTLRYANDKNIYLGDGGQKIYQYDLCGRRQKYYDMCSELGEKKTQFNLTEVLWVDNDALFFSCFRKNKYYEIWHIPLTRKKDLRMSEKEKIAEMKDLDCFITKTENEIVYSSDGKIYKMDLKTKRKNILKMGTDSLDCEIYKDKHELPLVYEKNIYYQDDKLDTYQLDIKSGNTMFIGSKMGFWSIETDGVNLYLEAQEKFVRYNLPTRKKVQLFTEDKLVEEVKNVKRRGEIFSSKEIWEDLEYYWEDLEYYNYIKAVYYYKDRLYVIVEVTREDVWEAWLMFSCQASDGSDFRFEKEISEYLWKNSIPYKTYYDMGESAYDLERITGEFLYFLDGCIVMHFYDQEAEGDEDAHHRFVVYDISTGTFRKVKKYSKEYGYFKALGFSETDDLVR